MAAGRPRRPTALKVIAGTDSKHPKNCSEPEPALLNDLEPPAHLHERSKAVWRSVAPMLRRIQVLTEADVLALELLCDAVADYRYARETRGDEMVSPTSKGGEMLSQWLVAQLASSKRAEALMSRFGMDPSSRARLMINPQGDLFGDSSKGAGRFFK